jgi:MFS family permease
MFHPEIRKNLRHNFTVNVLDGGFFGMALGFASSEAVIPLFVNNLTESATIISVLAAMHLIGWYLPQIVTANHVARLPRYRPMVLWMTLHERWPFLAMVAVALLVPVIGPTLALLLTFVLLGVQAFGGGFTATAWQSMVGKIIPPHRRGTFWGVQSALASVFMAISAYIAGVILATVAYPLNFALCFLLAGVAMLGSLGFLYLTREPEFEVPVEIVQRKVTWRDYVELMRGSRNLQVFTLARILSQFAYMALYLYTVYGVREYGMSETTAGLLAVTLTVTRTISNPLMGWVGDRIGNRQVFAFGVTAMTLSTLAALVGSSVDWLFVAFGLAGIGHTAIWTIGMTMTLDFGAPEQRPYIIGVVNTLIGPAVLISSIVGGALADLIGFDATFGLSAAVGVVASLMLWFMVRDPRGTVIQLETPAAVTGD